MIEKKWSVSDAGEAGKARKWLETHFPKGGWKIDLLGLEEDKASGKYLISVRCEFERDNDAAKFAESYLQVGTAWEVNSPQKPATPEDTEFSERAKQILSGPPPAAAGKLHFLDLAAVQAKFGADWPHMAARAEALVRRTIERRLSPSDVYKKTSDLNFVVVFGNLSGPEADLKCQMMAEEISRMLVGEEMGGGMLSVKTVATGVDGTKMLQGAGSSTDIVQAIEAEVEAERLRREAPQSTAPVDSDPFAGISFMYRPIWDVKRSAVANYYLLPVQSGPGGRIRHGDAELIGLSDPPVRRRFDMLVVDRVIADLQAMQRQNRRLLISFPIHFNTVSTVGHRQELVTRWRKLPADYRKLGIIEVVGAPEGVPQGRVAEIVSHLRLETRGLWVRTPLAAPSLGNFNETGLLAIGVEVGAQTGTEDRIMSLFRDFAAAAEKAHLPAYVHGLRSFSLTIGAIASGFAFVNGDPVSSISDRPDEAYRFGLSDLYRQRIRETDTKNENVPT